MKYNRVFSSYLYIYFAFHLFNVGQTILLTVAYIYGSDYCFLLSFSFSPNISNFQFRPRETHACAFYMIYQIFKSPGKQQYFSKNLTFENVYWHPLKPLLMLSFMPLPACIGATWSFSLVVKPHRDLALTVLVTRIHSSLKAYCIVNVFIQPGSQQTATA